MARYAITTSGNIATAANAERITSSATAHASSTTGDILGTPLYSDPFTAPSLTDKASGVGFFIESSNQSVGGVQRFTLQEDAGAGFVDTACIADYTQPAIPITNAYAFAKANTPYTFTTTTANKYRWKCVRQSGSGSLFRLRASTTGTTVWWGFFVDTRTGTIGTNDDFVVTTGITGTMYNALSFGSGTAAVQSTTPASFTTHAALVMPYAKLNVDTTANTSITHKGNISLDKFSDFEIGTIATPYPAAYTCTLTTDVNGVAGNFGIWTDRGNITWNGAAPTAYAVNYVSGLGTAANPMITTGDIGEVGDEVLISPTGLYNQTEYKFIKTKNSATSYVLADTSGGAETALVNTHSSAAYVANIRRNIIFQSNSTTLGNYWLHTGQAGEAYMKNIRTNYVGNSGVGKFGLCFGYSAGTTTMVIREMSGIVSNAYIYSGLYLLSNRVDYTTYSDNIFCRSTSSLPACTFGAFTNKVLNRWYFSGIAASAIGIQGGNNNILNDLVFHGVNTAGGTNGACIQWSGSALNNTYNNCSFQNSRVAALRNLSVAASGTFNNCLFGTVGTNTIDVGLGVNSIMDVTFADCTFASATLISGYINMIEGSEVRFQNMDGNTSKHRWYTNKGSAWSSGSGLTDTTVRTAGSLGLAIKPEDATTGFSWIFKVPANPASQVGVFGYGNRNATFSSGTFKVELFLPGTLLTGTPDATQTFSTTTGSWLPFNIAAYYSGSVARYAQVRITAITATANAFAFIDDLYDAGTGNKVAGLDLWDNGKPSAIMVQTDFSVVPSAVWGYSDSNTQVNTMGKHQSDAKLSNLLIKDKLS